MLTPTFAHHQRPSYEISMVLSVARCRITLKQVPCTHMPLCMQIHILTSCKHFYEKLVEPTSTEFCRFPHFHTYVLNRMIFSIQRHQLTKCRITIARSAMFYISPFTDRLSILLLCFYLSPQLPYKK